MVKRPRHKKHAKSKPKRKKNDSKKQSKKVVRNDRRRRGNRKPKKSTRVVKRKKLSKKSTHKRKVSLPAGRQVRKGPRKPKGLSSKAQVTVRHPRSKHVIELVFKGVTKITGKIYLVATSEDFEEAVERQLRRRGGRPPLGFIVIVEDNEGHVITRKSHPARHVDSEYVIALVNDLLEELKDNYDPDLYDAEEDGSGFANADPNRIVKITIKFFYGK